MPDTQPTWDRENAICGATINSANLAKQVVFGIDEAGRGCLAGPVYAAVVAWKDAASIPAGIRDSKKLSPEAREALFEPIRKQAWTTGIGFATAEEIDRWNILEATMLAATRALQKALDSWSDEEVAQREFTFFSDGKLPFLPRMQRFSVHEEYASQVEKARGLLARLPREEPLIKGDSLSLSIAAASILAKVARDRVMRELDQRYPLYRFAEHKGYVTRLHQELLVQYGPMPEHRRSFGPVRALLNK